MSAFKIMLKDNSKFRIFYLVNLFACSIAFVQIPAYVCLVFVFFWGVYLTYRNIKYNHCFDSMRFSFWLIAFVAVNVITMLMNLTTAFLQNFLMLMHIGICFFIFYGLHTEKENNAKQELYKTCKFVIYSTTILGAIGYIFMMCGVKFEWYWIKFIIYENRFTGVFINPNILGFISIVSIVCCHIVTKEDFLVQAKMPRISRIWLAGCLLVDIFSLMLCDSNASMVFFICYVVAILVFNLFSMKVKLSAKQLMLRLSALLMAVVFVVSMSFAVRNICQRAFSKLVAQPTVGISGEEYTIATDEVITFSHENANLDSGRIKLIKESMHLFRLSPIFGISNGNIIQYSQDYANGTLSLSYHNHDLHNGYLTILVSTGIVGLCLFAIFGLRFAKHIGLALFRRQNAQSQDVLPCLFAFCCAYLVYALFEKALLYDISFMVMWFWYMIGQTSVYLNKYEPLTQSYYTMHHHRLPRYML